MEEMEAEVAEEARSRAARREQHARQQDAEVIQFRHSYLIYYCRST
jgi:hypothetical protein